MHQPRWRWERSVLRKIIRLIGCLRRKRGLLLLIRSCDHISRAVVKLLYQYFNNIKSCIRSGNPISPERRIGFRYMRFFTRNLLFKMKKKKKEKHIWVYTIFTNSVYFKTDKINISDVALIFFYFEFWFGFISVSSEGRNAIFVCSGRFIRIDFKWNFRVRVKYRPTHAALYNIWFL